MAIRIDSPGKLAADRRGVFDRLSTWVSDPGADAAYDALPASKKGRIVSVDTARLLAPEFRSWSGRIRHTPSTGSPAGAYAHDRMMRELARPRTGSKRLLITAGGAGSGKTSQLKAQTSIAELVFDNQFKNLARARQILSLAVKHGWETDVVYVHRPFGDVVRAVIERSQRTGRWNALAELPDAHAEAQRTVVALWREFRMHANISAIYNASAGHAQQEPGSRIAIRSLGKGGSYHFGPHEEARQVIAKVLQASLAEGIVCLEVASIIAQGVRWREPRS
jgi:hypothetical protein